MSYYTDFNATILQNHVLHVLAHFLPLADQNVKFFNQFPTALKLLGPKLFLVVGRLKTTIYGINPFLAFFRLLSFLREELYHGTKLQIPLLHCRPARHCTYHPPTARTYFRLICECGCNMSRHVPTCT